MCILILSFLKGLAWDVIMGKYLCYADFGKEKTLMSRVFRNFSNMQQWLWKIWNDFRVCLWRRGFLRKVEKTRCMISQRLPRWCLVRREIEGGNLIFVLHFHNGEDPDFLLGMVGNWCHGIGHAEFPLPRSLPNAPLSYEAVVKSKEIGITRNFKL